MKPIKQHQLPMAPSTYYVWVGGSCDYGHEERCSGGASIIQFEGKDIDTYTTSDNHTTEFRMILTVMLHAMEVIPPSSDIVFLTNVAYIQQNYDRQPTEKTSNSDLIYRCIEAKTRHNKVTVKVVPFHKYQQMTTTHALAHQTMLKLRNK